jgi:hypothetical protein
LQKTLTSSSKSPTNLQNPKSPTGSLQKPTESYRILQKPTKPTESYRILQNPYRKHKPTGTYRNYQKPIISYKILQDPTESYRIPQKLVNSCRNPHKPAQTPRKTLETPGNP